MPDGPSPRLERIVGAFIPSACREEVLGDLREKSTGSWQFIRLAISVIPFVTLSRVRRTSDLQMRLTEALLIYGSFLAAAWYNEPDALPKHDSLFRVIIPATVDLIDLIFQDLWAEGAKWPRILTGAFAVGIGLGFNVYGEFFSVLLVVGFRALFGSRVNVAREASGTALRSIPLAAPGPVKNWLVAAAAGALAAALLALIGHPPGRANMAAIVVFVIVALKR